MSQDQILNQNISNDQESVEETEEEDDLEDVFEEDAEDVEDDVDMNEFVVIEGFEKYECNRQGQVRNRRTQKILKPNIVNDYHLVGLYKDGKQHKLLLHRIIAKTFIPNPNNYQDVDHKNRCKEDNNVHNLRWCDHSTNQFNRSWIHEVDRVPIGSTEIDVIKGCIFEGLFYFDKCFYKHGETIIKKYEGSVSGKQKVWHIYDIDGKCVQFYQSQFLSLYPQFYSDFFPETNNDD